MLKKILLSCFIIMFTFNSYAADRIKVIGQQQECGDYFIASNNNKYYLLERFRGPTPNDGDVIEGDFSSRSFGFKDVFYPRTGRCMLMIIFMMKIQ